MPPDPLEEPQKFFSALRASTNFWGQPATLPDKILDQRLLTRRSSHRLSHMTLKSPSLLRFVGLESKHQSCHALLV